MGTETRPPTFYIPTSTLEYIAVHRAYGIVQDLEELSGQICSLMRNSEKKLKKAKSILQELREYIKPLEEPEEDPGFLEFERRLKQGIPIKPTKQTECIKDSRTNYDEKRAFAFKMQGTDGEIDY
jgi:hypothetical protein